MLLRIEAVGLLGLTVLLAGPVPSALARARWPARAPRAALVLWQAVGLSGGLAILGAGLTLAAGSLGVGWAPGIAAIPSNWSRLDALGWIGVVLTVATGAWLVVVAAASASRVVIARRSHRQRLDAVATSLETHRSDDRYCLAQRRLGPPGDGGRVGRAPRDDLAGVRLVDHPLAVAYCLPGLRPRLVVSRGALQVLADDELRAVLAHERAHARGHHDLVIQPFVAWRETFPFLPAAPRAIAAVELLVEMLADDVAQRTCRTGDLRRALERLAGTYLGSSHSPDPTVGFQVAARTSRLATPPPPLPAPLRLAVYLAAIVLVVGPPVALLVS